MQTVLLLMPWGIQGKELPSNQLCLGSGQGRQSEWFRAMGQDIYIFPISRLSWEFSDKKGFHWKVQVQPKLFFFHLIPRKHWLLCFLLLLENLGLWDQWFQCCPSATISAPPFGEYEAFQVVWRRTGHLNNHHGGKWAVTLASSWTLVCVGFAKDLPKEGCWDFFFCCCYFSSVSELMGLVKDNP